MAVDRPEEAQVKETGSGPRLLADADFKRFREQQVTGKSTANLDPIEFIDSAQEQMSVAQVDKKVELLNTAISHGGSFDDIHRILSDMNEANLNDVELAFDKPTDRPDFKPVLKDMLSPSEYRQVEALLNRRDGETNVAGAIATAIEMSREDLYSGPEKGGLLIRTALSNLTAEEFTYAEKQWDETYKDQYGGMDLKTAIDSGNFMDMDKRLVRDFYATGVDKRTTAQIEEFAQAILTESANGTGAFVGNQAEILADVLSGPAAAEARKNLRGNAEFMNEFNMIFRGFSKAEDSLSEGRSISIATAARENPDRLEAVIARASDQERTAFREGRRLVGQEGLTPEQQEQVDYFLKVDKAFKDAGDELQQTLWADHLAYGDGKVEEERYESQDTLISDLRRLHTSSGLFSFITGDSHDREKLMTTIEGMSKQDWDLLQPVDGQASDYMKRLKESIASYATDDKERDDAFALLDRMAGAKSYLEAQGQTRPLSDVLAENAANGDRSAIVRELLHMSPEDKAAYLANTGELQTKLDAVVFPKTDEFAGTNSDETNAAFFLAQSLLTQLKETGSLPAPDKLNPVQTLARDIMDGKLADPAAGLARLNEIMQDDELKGKVNGIIDAMNSDPKSVSHGDLALLTMLEGLDSSHEKAGFDALRQGERVPLGTQMIGNGTLLPGENPYTRLLERSAEDIARIRPNLQPHQKEIFGWVEKNGEYQPIDALRAFSFDGEKKNYQESVSVNEYLDKIMVMPDAQRSDYLSDYSVRYRETAADALLRAAGHEGATQEQRDLIRILGEHNFEPTLADRVRMHVVNGTGKADELIAEFSKLSYDDRIRVKEDYLRDYKTDLGTTFLSTVQDNPAREVAAATELTPGAITDRELVKDLVLETQVQPGVPADSALPVEREVDALETAVETATLEGETLKPEQRQELVGNVVEAGDPPPPEPEQTDFAPPAKPVPSQALIDLAVVKRGEGPWQSAERILAADGKRHSIDEVRALTKAIQAVYAQGRGGNADMGGLKVKHGFITAENFPALIDAVSNPEVKALLQSMAAS